MLVLLPAGPGCLVPINYPDPDWSGNPPSWFDLLLAILLTAGVVGLFWYVGVS